MLIYPLFRHLIQALSDCGLYCVFDGHGGSDASCYAASQFTTNLLATSPQSDTYCDSVRENLLREAFEKTDTNFGSKAEKEVRLQRVHSGGSP